MRLLFVADGRSPIAINWMRYFVERGDEVYLASTFNCQPEIELKGLDVVHVALSGTKRPSASSAPLSVSSTSIGLRTAIRHYLGPLTISRAAKKLRTVIERIDPNLIHAMRVPYEGMLAADAYTGIPLLVSVWGNDFTLHAPSTPLMRHYTRWTMRVADALHADCQRDIRLAQEWGFAPRKPTLVIPGSGGIRTDVFFPPHKLVEEPIVFNPRGFRTYVRNDIFFKAIPLVLEQIPQARFLCASMAGAKQAEKWISALGINHAVELLTPRPHAKMADIYRRAAVLVSPSEHDGTPNSLLEGMATGCFPIAGDIESVREWITDGENGFLVNPSDPGALAEAIIRAFKNKDLRERAAGLNVNQVVQKAEYHACMSQAEMFYQRLVSASRT